METTLRERIDNSEFESVRTLCGGLYDAFASALELPGALLPARYRGKIPWTAVDSDKMPDDESIDSLDVSSCERINAIDDYLTDFPQAKIACTMSAKTIRRNHLESLHRQRCDEFKANEEFHQNRRVELLADSEQSDFGIFYSEIDYAKRDENILAFGRMLESSKFLETEIHVSPNW